MESVNNITATITDKDAKFYEKIVKKLQTLTLHSKESSETQNKQDIMISSTKASYDEHLEIMSFNNIIKCDTARRETEELLKNNFDEIKSKASSSIDMKAPALN